MAASTFGPVDMVAVEFPSERVPEAVRTALVDTLSSGAITLLDLAVLKRSDDGDLEVIEVENLGDELDITDIEITSAGLAGQEDLDEIAAAIPPGTSALVLVFENTWARQVVGAARDSGAVVIASERIPAEVVNEVAELTLGVTS